MCCVWASVASLGGGLRRLQLQEVGLFLEFDVGLLCLFGFVFYFGLDRGAARGNVPCSECEEYCCILLGNFLRFERKKIGLDSC